MSGTETASLIIAVDSTSTDKATASLLELVASAEAAEAAVAQLGATGSLGFTSISTTSASASESVQGLTSDFGELGNALVKFGLYLATFEALKEAVEGLVDAQVAVQRIQYTLESVTGSTAAASAEFKFLEQTSNLLGISLQSSALQYSRLEAASKSAGIPLDQTRALFLSLSTASSSLGLPVNNVNRALYALQEILDKNVVQARQFRQMLAIDIPGIGPIFQSNVMAWAKNVAHLTGSFDDLMKKGQLVASDMVPILIQSFNQLSNPGALLETTNNITANINRLGNAWFELRAQMGGGLFTDVANAGLKGLADNLGAIADVGTVAAGILLTRFAGQALGGVTASLVASTQATINSVAATDAFAAMNMEGAAAVVARTEAQVVQTASQVENTAATLTAVQAARADAESALVVAQAKTAEAEAAVAATTAIGAAAVTTGILRDAQAQLVLATEAESVALTELATLGTQQARVEATLIAATTGLIAAEEADVAAKAEQIAATAAYTEATSLATIAGGAFAAVGRGMLALIGGVPGLFLAAAAAVYYFATQTDEAEKELGKLDDVLARVKEGGAGDAGVGITLLGAGLQKLQSQSADLQPKIDTLKAQILEVQDAMMQGNAGSDEFGASTAGLSEHLNQLQSDLDKTTIAQKAFNDELKVLEGQIISGSMGAGGNSEIEFLKEYQKELDNLSKQKDKFNEDAATHGMGNAAKVQYEGSKEAGAITTQYANDPAKMKEALDTLSASYGPAYEAAQKYDAVLADQKGAKQAESEYDKIMKSLDDQAVRLQFAADNYKKYGDGVSTATDAVIKFRLTQGDLKNLSSDQKSDVSDAADRVAAAQKAQDAAKETKSYDDLINKINAEASAIGKTNVELEYQKDLLELTKKGLTSGTPKSDTQTSGLKDALTSADYAKSQQALKLYVQQQNLAIDGAEVMAAHLGDTTLAQAQLANELKAYGDIQTYSTGKTQDEIDAYTNARNQLLQYQNQLLSFQNAQKNSTQTGISTFFSTMHDDAMNSAKMINSLMTDTFNSIGTALANFVTTGKINFTSLVTSILADLVKLETDKLLENLIISNQGAIGGFFSGLASIFGATGTTSAASSVGNATIPGITMAAAVGSPVGANSITQVNEIGTETFNQGGKTYLLNGNQGGTVIPASQSSSGTGSTNNVGISVNVQNSNTNADAAEQGRQLGIAIKTVVQNELVKQQRPGGLLAASAR